ncbi:MAG: serine hydrolase [Rhodospirillaceae bacterium]|jgi:CubicO group peptidase (beta-lactamase class C family)|nr:serine hydrolase [Rhodospirillaceae bacterium]MBT6509346.1 serine hydrolase [Rhodospirillaceae bacterium]MBT7646495.1 serine hydrolase [Rhodospirillaceae bacterium]
MTVTPTNFQDRPHSAWGFHHVRELHPTAQVWRGAGPVWDLPTQTSDLEDVTFEGADGQSTTLTAMMAEPVHDGLLVLHKGTAVYEAYGNGMRPQDPHILMSTTKSFAGSLAGILAEQGVLDLNADVADLVADLKGTAYGGATVRQVLDMRVGLDYSEDYTDPKCDFAYMDAACGWRPPVEPGAPDNLLDHIRTIRSAPPHGGAFHYVSPTALVMGWVLEAATGETFAELVSRLIWQPMGAEFDGDLALDRCHRSQTEGGLNVTLRDLARFGELHRLGGTANGTRIVPEAWITDIRENGDPDAWDAGTMADIMPGHHYRAMWYTNRSHPHRPMMTMGAFGQTVYADPVAELTIAKLSSFPNAGDELFGEMFRCLQAITDALHGD